MNYVLMILIIVLFILIYIQKRNYETKFEHINDERKTVKIEIEKEIKALSDNIAILTEENSKLRKELEFFTKIDEDATRLNTTEDKEKEEQLMLKALAEVDTDASGMNTIYHSFQEVSDETERIIHDNNSMLDKIDESFSVLDKEQQDAFKIMSSSNQNMFITGKAGTGKSFLLKLFVRANNKKKVVLLAPTGISAININGATIHSAFGYANLVQASIEELENNIIKLNKDKRQVLYNVDTIIIDEISMVRADTFEKIDRILKSICRNNELFGGKQLILFGDLFQLPPITKPDEYRFLQDRFGGIYFFNSDVYKKGNFRFIELSINHRQQSDIPFFNVLNKIREGCVNSDDLAILNARTIFNVEELRRVIRLFPRKDEAERVNIQELEKIPAKEYVYDAVLKYSKPNMTGTLKWNSFPIEQHLRLKLGALVMMVANDSEKRWVNGTLGIISGLGNDYIKVKISNTSGITNEYQLSRYSFEEQEATYIDGKIEYESIFMVEQFPVTLAYAITIHKSQGMTYQQIACDVSECFTTGQAYVALSRCNTLSGLYLLKSVEANNLRVDENIRKFYLSQIE